MREKRIEAALVANVKAFGGWCLKLPAVFVSGLPDRLCLLPGGRAVFVELKAPGGDLSPIQKLVHRKLTSLGFTVEVVASMEAVADFKRRWLC